MVDTDERRAKSRQEVGARGCEWQKGHSRSVIYGNVRSFGDAFAAAGKLTVFQNSTSNTMAAAAGAANRLGALLLNSSRKTPPSRVPSGKPTPSVMNDS